MTDKNEMLKELVTWAKHKDINATLGMMPWNSVDALPLIPYLHSGLSGLPS